MKGMHLVPVQTRKFKVTTNSNHSLPVAPNLLKKDFKADEPCQKWVGDISYIATEKIIVKGRKNPCFLNQT